MTTDTSPSPAADGAGDEVPVRSTRRRNLLLAILVIIALDIVAVILFAPPGFPGPQQSIRGNLELIPPTVVWDLAPRAVEPAGDRLANGEDVVERRRRRHDAGSIRWTPPSVEVT